MRNRVIIVYPVHEKTILRKQNRYGQEAKRDITLGGGCRRRSATPLASGTRSALPQLADIATSTNVAGGAHGVATSQVRGGYQLRTSLPTRLDSSLI